MKKISRYLLSLSVSAIALTAASSAMAQSDSNDRWANWYASATGDVTWLQGYDTGGGGDVAVGVRFWPSDYSDFRLEAEAGYHDVSSSHYFTYMGNLYYDFNGLNAGSNSNWKVIPYIGAGMGDATVHLSNSDFAGRYTVHDDAFAYQFMAGVTLENAAMPNTDWLIGYRYFGTEDVDGTDNAGIGESQRLHANNLEVGLRWHF